MRDLDSAPVLENGRLFTSDLIAIGMGDRDHAAKAGDLLAPDLINCRSAAA
jgi:hypothetical protein